MAEGRGCIGYPARATRIAGLTTMSRSLGGSLGTSLGDRENRSPLQSPIPGFQPFPGVSQGFHSCPVVRYLPKSRVAHNPKVAGSNPAPATNHGTPVSEQVPFPFSNIRPIRLRQQPDQVYVLGQLGLSEFRCFREQRRDVLNCAVDVVANISSAESSCEVS